MSKIAYTPEHPLLFDGAMGTLFAALPGRAGEPHMVIMAGM